MALSPTTTYVNASVEQPGEVTKHKNLFPGSVQTVTIATGAYTHTVGTITATEVRPYSLAKVVVTSGQFTSNATITLDKNYHQPGDVIEVVFTPADVPSPRTLTIVDDASTPNTLATISSTTDSSRTTSTRKFVLGTAALWLDASVVSAPTGTVTASAITTATVTASGAITAASVAASGAVTAATVTATGVVTVGTVVGGVQSLSGAGAIDVTNLTTRLVTTGANALTLADGVNGQLKIITLVTDGGDGTLTPTTKTGYSTITFNDALDTIVLVFLTTLGWVIVVNNGTTVA